MSGTAVTLDILKKTADIFIEKFKQQDARIKKLEARVSALEQYPMAYVGIYQSGRDYKKNEIVTYGGGLWICLADKTMAKPGDGPDWKLCVKAGRDGKDAR